MKTSPLIIGALTAVLAMPLGAYAQQSQPPPPATQTQGRVTPSESVIQNRWTKALGGLNLSNQQQQQVQSLINQYSQAHPAGSPRDRQANRALRRQIMGVLTQDQQNQFHQQMQARHAAAQQRREQMQQQPAGQQPPQGQQPPPGQQPPNPPPA